MHMRNKVGYIIIINAINTLVMKYTTYTYIQTIYLNIVRCAIWLFASNDAIPGNNALVMFTLSTDSTNTWI